MISAQFSPVRAGSLQANRIASLLVAGVCCFGLGTIGLKLQPLADFQPATPVDSRDVANLSAAPIQPSASNIIEEAGDDVVARDIAAVETPIAEAAKEIKNLAETALQPQTPETVTRLVDLDKGQSFAKLLTDADIDENEAAAISQELDKVYSHRKLKAGEEITLSFTRLGTEETLNSLTFQPEPTKEVVISRVADGTFKAELKVTPLQRQRLAAKATIRSSLYEAGQRADVPRSIMAAMIRAYSHAVDFQRDLKPGDKFEVLYDQPTAKDGTPVGQGVIIYAALEIAGKVRPLYRVTFADGAVDYFDEKGQSLKRSLLRTPIDGARMTSGFGMRMHPILGYSKMHKGVDFAASTGTPIFAAGSGVIEEVGLKGAYGRYIRIRHNNTLKTAYAHMSRFGRGIYQGAKVNQGDVIGFVGTSGRSTGPHLHYEVLVNNRQANPMSVNLPTGRVLEGKLLSQFKSGQSKIKSEFQTLLNQQASATKASKVELASSETLKLQPVNATVAAFPKPTSQSCGQNEGC